MKKFAICSGIIIIIIVSVIAIKYDDLSYWYEHTFNEKNYVAAVPNNYYLEDNFMYINNYSKNQIYNKKQLMNFIYYYINTGSESIKGYCDKDYIDCIKDIEEVSADTNRDTLSILNNFVHPYNSFSKIKIKYNTKGEFTITNEKLYTSEQINAINKVVDDFIKTNVDKKDDVKTNLKKIHDYIIDTTDYDKLKTANIKDTTYNSQNAYGVLIEHYGICSGYSDTMAIFLTKLNIPNYKISNNEHIWNIAFVDGKWLHIDLTWDDPVTDENTNRDNYFLITTDELLNQNDNSHNFDRNIFKEA